MKSFWWENKNFGDIIAPIILEHFSGEKVERSIDKEENRFLVIGSLVASAMSKGDTVWGIGLIEDKRVDGTGVEILSLRGPMTEERVENNTTDIFGDTGLLISEIYNPEVEVKHKLGVIPHFIEKENYENCGEFLINIKDDWKKVIEDIKSCEMIASSTLHGIVTAETYGIPTVWLRPGKGIKGGEFKFQDYFLGTDRKEQKTSTLQDMNVLDKIENLEDIKTRIKKAFYGHSLPIQER
jgi:pyruvyltransferase